MQIVVRYNNNVETVFTKNYYTKFIVVYSNSLSLFNVNVKKVLMEVNILSKYSFIPINNRNSN